MIFSEAIARINPELGAGDLTRLLADVKLLLENEDLGKAFYDRLTARSGTRLIDFGNFNNNSFHVVTELTCKTVTMSSALTSPCSSTACRSPSARSRNPTTAKVCWPSATASSRAVSWVG